jgi:uncharacterized membrane protein
MIQAIYDERLEHLPASVLDNIAQIDELKGRWVVITPKELSDTLGIPRPTINQVLNRLLDLEKIERIGLGRGTRYRVR